MRRVGFVTILGVGVAAAHLALAASAYADVSAAPTPGAPPQDNGAHVALYALLIFLGIVGMMVFIAKAYLDRDDQ